MAGLSLIKARCEKARCERHPICRCSARDSVETRRERKSANAEIQPGYVISRFNRADNSARLVVSFIGRLQQKHTF